MGESEREELKRKLAAVQRQSDGATDELCKGKRSSASVLALRDESVRELGMQIEELKKIKHQAQAQVDALSNEIADLTQGFNEEENRLTSTLVSTEESIHKLEKEKEEVEKENGQAQSEIGVLSNELAETQDKADRLANDYIKIEENRQKELHSVESEREELKRKLAAVQRQSDGATDE